MERKRAYRKQACPCDDFNPYGDPYCMDVVPYANPASSAAPSYIQFYSSELDLDQNTGTTMNPLYL